MRAFARSLPVVAVAAIAVFAAVATLKSQDNASGSPQTWEYATVFGSANTGVTFNDLQGGAVGIVHICFASDTGCRYEAVEVKFTIPPPSTASYNQAFAKAAARLGAEGWELTTTTQADGVIQMYFRKPLTPR